MSLQEAALVDPTKLGEVFKHHVPFLRRDTLQRLADVVTALIQARSTKHARLALHLPGETDAVSKLRRVERCLHDPQLDHDVFLKLLLPLLPDQKLVMTMDRTFLGRTDALEDACPQLGARRSRLEPPRARRGA